MIITNCELNKLVLVTKSLSRFNIDLFHKFLYYNLLSSRFFYYSNFLLFLKKKPLTKAVLGSNFKKRRLYTVLRSPFIHKKSREQFELRIFKSNFVLYSIFNTQYYCSSFVCNWLPFLICSFKNNHSQLRSENIYYLRRITE